MATGVSVGAGVFVGCATDMVVSVSAEPADGDAGVGRTSVPQPRVSKAIPTMTISLMNKRLGITFLKILGLKILGTTS